MINIEHTPAQGTVVLGTVRDERISAAMRAGGFRWSRRQGFWYLPRSIDTPAQRGRIDSLAAELRDAGFEVDVCVDDSARPFEEAEHDRSQRQAGRVEALGDKAQRLHSHAESAWERRQQAIDRLPPLGEPIHVGHHSERRHRRDIRRADTATRRALEASETAREASRAAQAAAATTPHRYSPITVKNRIDRLSAELRRDERLLTGYRRVVARTDTAEYVDEQPPATGDRRAQIESRMQQYREELDYWRTVRERQIEQGEVVDYGPDTIRVGDHVQLRAHWFEVKRVNAKSVSIRLPDGMVGPRTLAYHKLTGHRPAQP